MACSTKKDAVVNRNWHALNTKYNVLYNGEVAFEEGRAALQESYKDNFWQVLPIERMTVIDEVTLDTESKTPQFSLAEEKATKAIQRHSMDIKDEERNPRIDEAFLLLGKARYFDQRFIPALEAFNHVLQKYDSSDKLNEAAIWREKVNIRLQNEESAIANLKRLFKYETLSDQEYADGRAMMAQAHMNLNNLDSALAQLKIAAVYTRKNEERGRYFFILGQLYNRLNFKDSANLAFEKVIALNRKVPRAYLVNAQLLQQQNVALTNDNATEILEYLTGLSENRENRPFLDKIYRQLALYHLNRGNDSLAVTFFNTSITASQNEAQLLAYNYEDLAAYHFDKNEYQRSGAYYDSVLMQLSENTRDYRSVKKKLDNLEDVIRYEDIVQKSDSVLTLVALSETERTAYFENYIAAIKTKEAADTAKEEKRQNAGVVAFANTPGGKKNKGKFYFYNIASLGYGKTSFKQVWGDRPLEDNWRWSTKTSANLVVESGAGETTESTAVVALENGYDVEAYLASIPNEKVVIDSISAARNFANYQLGLIYKEKFKEYLLAAKKLQLVLDNQPEERLVLPSKYNLYKIYEMVQSPLASDMKQNIIANHPNSRYTEILLNPSAGTEADALGPEARYADLFKQFERQEYLAVITGAAENIEAFTGDPIVSKLELLKANALGRLQGFKAFKEALGYVALNYPNTAEGRQAEAMITNQLPKLESTTFLADEAAPKNANWKLVFPVASQSKEQNKQLQATIEKAVSDLKYKNKVSNDVYTLAQHFIVVHGFTKKEFAQGFAELLQNNKDYKLKDANFVILSENYKVVQIHKNLNTFNSL